MEVKIRNKKFQVIIPEFEINVEVLSESLEKDTFIKKKSNEDKIRERQEYFFIGSHQEESKFKPKKKRRFHLFKRKKQQPEPAILEALPEETSTVVLDDDIPFIVLESQNKMTGDIIVNKEEFPIGRMMDCLKDIDFISRCHGLIYAEDYQHVYFGDTSQNFNYINDQRLKHFEYYELKNNDILRFRDLQYVVKMGDNHG